eukprot:1357213-Amphidinium_carterae.1
MEKPKNGKRVFLKKIPLVYVLFFFPNQSCGLRSSECAHPLKVAVARNSREGLTGLALFHCHSLPTNTVPP